MKKFNSVVLNEDDGKVDLGGGAITRDVVLILSEQGFYTSVPTSNAVGMIGYCLGGGSSAINGLKGLAIDNLLRIRMVTAPGEVLELGPGTAGEEGELFNVLCGAGFGFGVIATITLRAWRINDLQMNDDKIWTRKLIFPPPAIDTAAELFTKLQQPDRRMTPGAPVILLNLNYLGPAAEAEKAAAITFDASYTSSAIVAESGSIPFSAINDMAEPLNRHGDFKEMYAPWLQSVSAASIAAAFELWARFGEQTSEAKATSYVVFAAKSTKAMLHHDVEGKKFFPRAIRGRSVFVQVTPWWTAKSAEPNARRWAAEMLQSVSADQHDDGADSRSLVEGEKVSAFAANLSKGFDIRTVWPSHQIQEIKRLKEVWDPINVFWNPVIDGV